ncbi:MAG: polyprenyl synthetase family protein [Deltaproteobacteria bacterium]|nr:polyprenyl synthetase family protein [Deltaproteobacteria bacterium]
MKIALYLEEKRQKTDRFLESVVREEGSSDRLKEAIRYSLLAGGKRIRPILLMAASEACGAGNEIEELTLPVGAALEMIHTYSLIHDDLPAMDNDDLRRGRLTNHKVYGEAMAILAGDSLLTEAFNLISSLKTQKPQRILDVIREIASSAGVEGMAGGQALDLNAEGRRISPEELERLHRMKTGRLICAAVVSGAILAEAAEKQLMAIRNYGFAIGLAFQIADDILDVEGESKVLGKTAQSDAAHAKSTYPSLLGLEKSKRLAQESTDKAISALQIFNGQAEPLREIARYIISRQF